MKCSSLIFPPLHGPAYLPTVLRRKPDGSMDSLPSMDLSMCLQEHRRNGDEVHTPFILQISNHYEQLKAHIGPFRE